MEAPDKARDQPLHDVVASSWGRLATVLGSISKHRSGQNGAVQQAQLVQACIALVGDQPAGAHVPLERT
eukprot:8384768-Pyramimonas_sp.AAC.1